MCSKLNILALLGDLHISNVINILDSKGCINTYKNYAVVISINL
jgi:hypothetical protein